MRQEGKLISLIQDEFKSALRKGQGRAYLYVKQNGLDGVHDLVLEACLHNQAYDPQCESSRSDWLFSMFRDTPYYQTIKNHILAALETETETWDLLQMCQLVKLMAERGDTQAQEGLKAFVFRIARTPSEHEWLGAEEWINFEGVDGLLDLARIYGERLQSDPEDWVNDDLLDYYPNPDYKETLFKQSKLEPSIYKYWQYLEKRGRLEERSRIGDLEAYKVEQHKRIRKQILLTDILKEAKQKKGTHTIRYASFGRHATNDELDTVYQKLLSEEDDEVRVRLLWVFRRVSLPKLDSILFEWANGSSERLRSASIAALAQVKDARVHNLALSKVRDGHLTGADHEAIDLFLKNYESQDAPIIASSLHQLKELDSESAHSIGYSLDRLAEEYGDPGLSDALKWVYEETPCTNCRSNAIIQLDRIQQLSKDIQYECQYDADDSIRDYVKKKVEHGCTGNIKS